MDICDFLPELTTDNDPSEQNAEIVVSVADDHSLSIKLKTGQNFGCLKFEPIKP